MSVDCGERKRSSGSSREVVAIFIKLQTLTLIFHYREREREREKFENFGRLKICGCDREEVRRGRDYQRVKDKKNSIINK